MSLDITDSLPTSDRSDTGGEQSNAGIPQDEGPLIGKLSVGKMPVVDNSQWKTLRRRILAHAKKVSAKDLFAASAEGGGVYRWGIAAASGGPCANWLIHLSGIACDRRSVTKRGTAGLIAEAEDVIERLSSNRPLSAIDSAAAVTWASALPGLTEVLDQQAWWRLLACLQQLREAVLQRSESGTPAQLLVGAELGLTLAWRLTDLPSCKRLEKSSADALTTWCKHDDESISASISKAVEARLVLASLLRCRRIIVKTTKRKFKKQQIAVGEDLATWVAALTTHTGSTALSGASRQDVADDLPPHGLLGRTIEFAAESLEPAISAALGKCQSGGRLAWEVSLPEAFHHDDDAKIAVMFADWDVRRGRMHFDYSSSETRLELFAGRRPVIAGHCQSMIELDGIEQQACGDWDTTCEYSDDDVHYLEIEQPWTGDVVLQRQLMLVRDDRCVLMADCVLPKGSSLASAETRKIQYHCRLPLAESISIDAENETREVFFRDKKRRGMVIPLAAGEWRVGPTNATLKTTRDHHLVLSARGTGRLYAPIWFDFQQRRFKRKRTWRQLTVADQLRIVGDGEAVGYRVQVGSEQWLIYRSLLDRRCRSVLGKHLIADFYSARFDTGDGSLEELVTVDDNDLIDD